MKLITYLFKNLVITELAGVKVDEEKKGQAGVSDVVDGAPKMRFNFFLGPFFFSPFLCFQIGRCRRVRLIRHRGE